MIVFEKEGAQHHVQFPNRCFFCLVKVSSDFNALSYDTSKQVHFPVQWFQEAFSHLVPDSDKNSIEFGKSPPICVACGNLLEVMRAALIQLTSVTIEVKSRIYNLGGDATNKEQRLNDFLTDFQSTSGTSGSMQEALNILERIGHGSFPTWRNWLQRFTSKEKCTDGQDAEVWDKEEGYGSETESQEDDVEILNAVQDVVKVAHAFVTDLEKIEPGLENELKYREEDEELFNKDDDVDMEPIPDPTEAAFRVVTMQKQVILPALHPYPYCSIQFPPEIIQNHIRNDHGTCPDSVATWKNRPFTFPSTYKMNLQCEAHSHEGIKIRPNLSQDETVVDSLIPLGKQVQFTPSGIGKTRKKGKFKCDECPNEVFRTETSLMSHQIQFHGADPFMCQFCGREFEMWTLLSRHEYQHKTVVRNGFICDFPGCGTTFIRKSDLDQHKRWIHLGERNTFVCGECGKGFNHRKLLTKHKVGVHCTERKFVCEECGENFKLANVLKKHKMIHTGEKPFECHFCHQKFRYKEVLTRHVTGHQNKGANFRPNGSMEKLRKRVNPKGYTRDKQTVASS